MSVYSEDIEKEAMVNPREGKTTDSVGGQKCVVLAARGGSIATQLANIRCGEAPTEWNVRFSKGVQMFRVISGGCQTRRSKGGSVQAQGWWLGSMTMRYESGWTVTPTERAMRKRIGNR